MLHISILMLMALVGPLGAPKAHAPTRPLVRSSTRPTRPTRSTRPTVLPGIDVLLADSAHLVDGKRVGLITNQNGLDARGVPTIDRLAHRPGVQLVMLFAPEHGIRGAARPGEQVGDTADAATGLPIYSLYGASRAPSAAQLDRLDVLVLDLQDAGARTFTYVSTMVLALKAVKAAGKRLVVLDRPNPIGCTMDGPVLDTSFASFIGLLPVPLRHGLTMGELARFANAQQGIGADLVVVPMRGYRRCMWYDETGLRWVRPSPNLPDLEAVAWYPGTVLFEGANVSVGRGTDAPFTQVGAPWLDPDLLLRADPGVAELVRPVRFTPRAPGDGKFDGVALRGVRWRAARARDGNVVEHALRLMHALATVFPDSFRVDSTDLARRLGVRYDPRHPPDCGSDFGDCRAWTVELASFRRDVLPYLLYR